MKARSVFTLVGLAISNENRKEIDLLMTDVVMPDMSGRELADKLWHFNISIQA
jgi:YesN/AraC family two-component response regulator